MYFHIIYRQFSLSCLHLLAQHTKFYFPFIRPFIWLLIGIERAPKKLFRGHHQIAICVAPMGNPNNGIVIIFQNIFFAKKLVFHITFDFVDWRDNFIFQWQFPWKHFCLCKYWTIFWHSKTYTHDQHKSSHITNFMSSVVYFLSRFFFRIHGSEKNYCNVYIVPIIWFKSNIYTCIRVYTYMEEKILISK